MPHPDAAAGNLLPPLFSAFFGRVLLALGAVGLGVLALMHHDFAMQWQPVPEQWPARQMLALVNGVAMIVLGASLLFAPARRWGAWALGAYFMLWAIVLHTPRLVAGVEAAWNGMAEATAIAAGCFAIAARGDRRLERGTQMLLGVCAPVFGVAHFIYADFTASMIPAFIPGALFFAYLTGWGHVLAGVSLMTGTFARLGATLYGVMILCFVFLLHVPRTIAAPEARIEWTMLAISLAMAGAVWSVAATTRRNSDQVLEAASRPGGASAT